MKKRIFIEKKEQFNSSKRLAAAWQKAWRLPQIQNLRQFNIYDIYNCPEELLPLAIERVFSDPVTDDVLEALPEGAYTLAYELVPGQFDMRADSAKKCLQALDPRFADVQVFSAQALVFIDGEFDLDAQRQIKSNLVNPIECRLKDLNRLEMPKALQAPQVEYYNQFNDLTQEELKVWREEQGLAMNFVDLYMVQLHFKSIRRPPREAEIRALDTYWSDHCRHTTFGTVIKNIDFPSGALGRVLEQEFKRFQEIQRFVGIEEPERGFSLMDLAVIDTKYQRKKGNLADVEFSKEINACSVKVEVEEEEGQSREWLLQFKNETHNHPTEIEPFGGAATCVGGAIRDPLAGRAYIYQAARISGGADPRQPIQDTLKGKLPQRTIAQESAKGYSSYGNQIGLATGQVTEFYHEGYLAKHMELGAVVGAVPLDHVQRAEPVAGDLVLLVGGATGRDGCGGATGSSKAQNQQSIELAGAEVQKGNAPEERKLQRLFRNKAFAEKIKRCNDFGAGGVSVAVGELADGIKINLDAIPVKYAGLSGTELAISESQERMAIVIAPEHKELMLKLAEEENVEATEIAVITDDRTLTMIWQGDEIVSLSRDFLDTNGAPAYQERVQLPEVNLEALCPVSNDENWEALFHEQLKSLKFADQRGLGDGFDHSVGASCVLLPYGGKTQRTPIEASVYLLPTDLQSPTASVLAHGFNPDVSAVSPYHGGLLAVIEATAKVVACGGDATKIHYSLQEYFRRLGDVPENWGQAVAALMGAHHALQALERAAIGGKDSMSGSYHDIHVPPTLVGFAVTTIDAKKVVSPEFKKAGHHVYWLRCPTDEFHRPNLETFKWNNEIIKNIRPVLQSARAIRHGGIVQALYEACLGNKIGVYVPRGRDLFKAEYGSYLISTNEPLDMEKIPHLEYLGMTMERPDLEIDFKRQPIEALYEMASATLKEIYPLYPDEQEQQRITEASQPLKLATTPKSYAMPNIKIAQPRVALPVFYGMNSELDTARAFKRNGAVVQETVIRNRDFTALEESLSVLAKQIQNSQIFVLSGGFSAGDEPDGSGKFIANILGSPRIKDALEDLLRRDGLILGICNGFQALIKSGLLPNGNLEKPVAEGSATLTHNLIGRHISRVATTVVANNHSPWLRDFKIGEMHDVDFSHGEGRFISSPEVLEALLKNGQIAFQYAHPDTGEPSNHIHHNINGSLYAVEGLISPCGRILGKMGHPERYQPYTHANYPDFRPQNIFRAGVSAFGS